MSILSMKIDEISLESAVAHVKKNCSSSDFDRLRSLPDSKEGFQLFRRSDDWDLIVGRKPVASVFKMSETDVAVYSPASKCFQFFWIESDQAAYIIFDLSCNVSIGDDCVFSYIIDMYHEGWRCAERNELHDKIPQLLL